MSQRNRRILFWPVSAVLAVTGCVLLLGSFQNRWSRDGGYFVLGLLLIWIGWAELLNFHPYRSVQSKSMGTRWFSGVINLALGCLYFFFVISDRRYTAIGLGTALLALLSAAAVTAITKKGNSIR